MRRLTRREIRIPAFVMIIAAVVTAIELSMHALLPELHRVLGLFLPLIVTNCAILGRAEAYASRNAPARAALDGFAVGVGFLWVLLLLGSIREVLGQGSLFAGAGALIHAPFLELQVGDYRGVLIMALPPGAFIVLALLIAGRNRLVRWQTGRSASQTATALEPSQ